MELILLKDIEKVGRKGQVIRVRDGFARNFLLPQKFAFPSTRANREFVEELKVRAAKKHEKELAAAQKEADALGQVRLTLEARAGEQDKLFGSVTSEDIQEALERRGLKVDKKHIHLRDPIRALGSHQVVVELYPQVKTTVTVEVIKKS